MAAIRCQDKNYFLAITTKCTRRSVERHTQFNVPLYRLSYRRLVETKAIKLGSLG